MSSYLDQILASIRERNEAMKVALGPNDTSRLVAQRGDSPRGFAAAVSPSTDRILIVGEIKNATPDGGIIRDDFDAGSIARDLQASGAVALSVATESQFYQGSLDDLQSARENTHIPVLRKDFIIDPYQVPRSYGAGADAILVIVRAVPDDGVLQQIFDAAENIHLDVLTEVNDERDCERLLKIGQNVPNALRVVGVSSRNLDTFQIDLSRPAKLAAFFSDATTLLTLGGIKTRADIQTIADSCPRLNRFVVGSALLRAKYPGDALSALLKAEE